MNPCHWVAWGQIPCDAKATEMLEDSKLWYCPKHFNEVIANREWLAWYVQRANAPREEAA